MLALWLIALWLAVNALTVLAGAAIVAREHRRA